jgi:hypothetical protein
MSRDSLANAVVPDLVYRGPAGPDGTVGLWSDSLPTVAMVDLRGLGRS